MRVYFAGANSHLLCNVVKGQYVLESFADIRPLVRRYRRSFRGLMLDSGAYTEKTQGIVVDLHEYGSFAAEHASDYDAVVNLDDIGGDVDKSIRNEQVLRDTFGLDPIPVFHQGEPFSVLSEYCARADLVGLGFQRPLLSVAERRSWLDRCFEVVPYGHRLHGFAMTLFMGQYPFHSVDSTSWLRDWMDISYGSNGRAPGQLGEFLTPPEILEIVIKRWERMPRCTTWKHTSKETDQMVLF